MAIINGSNLDDFLFGTADPDLISGYAGNDIIDGRLGYDTLLGGDGEDSLYSYDADSIDGGNGVDYALIDRTGSTFAYNLNIFDSTILNILMDGTEIVNVERLSFYGGADEDIVTGGDFNDELIGNGSDDILRGNGGDDYLSGDDGGDWLQGDDGNDALIGGAGFDGMVGGSGDDYFESIDADLIDGMDGLDTAYIDRQFSDIDFHIDISDPDVFQTLADGSFLVHVEQITFNGGAGNDTVIGGDFDDVLGAGSGRDSLSGGSGNDQFYLNYDNLADTVEGGSGDDTAYLNYSACSDAIDADFGKPTVTTVLPDGTRVRGIEYLVLASGSGDDTIFGAEAGNLIFGNAGNDSIRGGEGIDTLLGLEDNDWLNGDSGDDFIDGNTGSDTLLGGAGDDYLKPDASVGTNIGSDDGVRDYIDGGEGVDKVEIYFNDANTSIKADFTDSTAVQTLAYGTSIVNVETIYFVSGSGDDIITGGSYDDAVWGGAGKDLLSGGAGSDALIGDDGRDTLLGGSGDDRLFNGPDDRKGCVIDGGTGIDYAEMDFSRWNLEATTKPRGLTLDFSNPNVTVRLPYDSKIVNVEQISITTSSGDDRVTGSIYDDTINGGAGKDTLLGGGGGDNINGDAGRDLIIGGGGSDQLKGGSGEDIFRYMAVSDGGDQIFDYEVGDVFDLALIDANAGTQGNQSFSFIGTNGFTGTAGELRYDAAVFGWSHVEADTNGDGQADFEIKVSGSFAFTASDFIL
ncbi:calcium-binding protein [Prosthecomicrobium sp. N25]|uniref:calcium-binding protein n=1 Tax=Prosthecomicrobium sp. N25 TaxID=3129254 RepID=UPI003077CEB8